MKEGNVLFNDALNTFYLRLYGVRHMVKDHSDSEKGNPLPPHRLLFQVMNVCVCMCDDDDVYVCMYECVCVCMYVCVYVFV